jgi:Zn-dependent protease with chaperone function
MDGIAIPPAAFPRTVGPDTSCLNKKRLFAVKTQESAAFQSLKISTKNRGLMQLFTTHPPPEVRIARLESGH